MQRIFICHSQDDVDFCRELASALRLAGADVWYDEAHLGTNVLLEVIDRELRGRPTFIVLLSPSALRSKWVQNECIWAFNRYNNDNSRVILPVVVKPISIADIWTFIEQFPRIEAAEGQPYPTAEAIERILDVLKLSYSTRTAIEEKLRKEFEQYMAEAQSSSERGDNLQAAALYQKAAQTQPTSAEAWIGLGDTLTILHLYQDALAAYLKASECPMLKPSLAFLWDRQIADTYEALGRHADAQSAHNRARMEWPSINW